jgi:hypothetical protein
MCDRPGAHTVTPPAGRPGAERPAEGQARLTLSARTFAPCEVSWSAPSKRHRAGVLVEVPRAGLVVR